MTGEIEVKLFRMYGGPGGVRTLDLMTARQNKLVYLVDFAAHLATERYEKTHPER
jgi:hypothetical protein